MARIVLEIEDSEAVLEIFKKQQAIDAQAMLAAKAEFLRLSTVYKIDGEPEPDEPHGGLLTKRMKMSESSVRKLITTGKLGYFCGAKKAYRVSERAVRRFEDGLPPLEQAA